VKESHQGQRADRLRLPAAIDVERVVLVVPDDEVVVIECERGRRIAGAG
jgi:hypothetical protein